VETRSPSGGRERVSPGACLDAACGEGSQMAARWYTVKVEGALGGHRAVEGGRMRQAAGVRCGEYAGCGGKLGGEGSQSGRA
jgi:hypothetical protein